MGKPRFAIVGLGMVTGPYPEGITARAAEAEAGRLAIADAGLRREDIRVGMPVEVTYEDITPEWTLPKFKPAAG